MGMSKSALSERNTVRDRPQENRLVEHRGQGASMAGKVVPQTGHVGE
jgi:hypothetical protein